MQAALLAKPEIVLDLLGFGLSEASGSFESVFGIRLERPRNAPSVEDGSTPAPRLAHGIDASEYWQQGTRVEDLTEAFSTFREDGKKTRIAEITEAITRTLPYQAGDPTFFDLIAEEAGADICKHWTSPPKTSSRAYLRLILLISCANSSAAMREMTVPLVSPSLKGRES